MMQMDLKSKEIRKKSISRKNLFVLDSNGMSRLLNKSDPGIFLA